MTKDQIVCSIELAERLKELGVKQESLFYWNETEKDNDYWLGEYGPIIDIDLSEDKTGDYCSAYTSDELGEMLPRVGWFTSTNKEGSYVSFLNVATGEKRFDDNTMANSMARMLIYLKENKLID